MWICVVAQSFETSESTYAATERNMPEDLYILTYIGYNCFKLF
jgi:hypothetical protein